jgi:hypothetical protein
MLIAFKVPWEDPNKEWVLPAQIDVVGTSGVGRKRSAYL